MQKRSFDRSSDRGSRDREAGVMMEEGEDRHMAKEEIETIIEVMIEIVEEDRRMRVIEVIIKRSGDN